MKKVIVTTTINPPTKAIRLFEEMEDWDLVVIADRKTPEDYTLRRGILVTPEMQEQYDPSLSEAIGWNCIQRRNFGLLWAHDMRADVVAVVDDDNIPYEHWGRNLMIGQPVEVNYYETALPAFDPVGATNERHIWHRGYPLQLLPQRDYTVCKKRSITADVQADFWNGDPDIDAICRMEHAPAASFEPGWFPLASNALSPFNSQNTFLKASMLGAYFLFPHIGRMDDIWASYYVQSKGAVVVYGAPTVFQERNAHNLVKDMKAEYIGYENNLDIVQDRAGAAERILGLLPQRSLDAFHLYRRHFNA